MIIIKKYESQDIVSIENMGNLIDNISECSESYSLVTIRLPSLLTSRQNFAESILLSLVSRPLCIYIYIGRG